jgi:hypothetical protein
MWAEPAPPDDWYDWEEEDWPDEFVVTFNIPPITASAANLIMQSIKSDALRIINDWKAVRITERLGVYTELVLGEHAHAACRRIESGLPKVGEPSRDRVLEWDPELMPIGSADDLGIDQGTTPEELDAIEDGLKEVLGEAWPEAGTVLIWRGLRERLEQVWTRATGAVK